MRWFLLLSAALASASCGRFGFDPFAARAGDGGTNDGQAGDGQASDATVDAAPCVLGPFSAATLVPNVNSSDTDWGPALSHDGLTLVFASTRDGTSEIFQSTRTATDQPWSAATAVMAAGSAYQGGDPYLSADELSLYTGGVYVVTRTDKLSPWTGNTQVLANAPMYNSPDGPDLSADGLRLVFTATKDSDGLSHMYQTTRASTAVAFGDGSELPGVDTAHGESFGSMTDDGLDLVFQRDDDLTSVWEATRATTTDPFGTAVAISQLDVSGANNVDADLSDDGRTLLFASTRPGGLGDYDLWVSTRACE